MTDRVKGFNVTLESDVRIDDIETIMNAIKMIKGVVDVEPNIVTTDDLFNRVRIKNEYRNKLYKFINDEFEK